MARVMIRSARDDVWRTLLDPTTWAGWFPLGSPEITGAGWAEGGELIWSGAAGQARAVIDTFQPELLGRLEITFVAGDDGLPHKRGDTVRWDFLLTERPGGTEVWITRRARPLTLPRAVDRLRNAVLAVERDFQVALERAPSMSSAVPDVEALHAANDTDGLLRALAHPESWVRSGAVVALAEPQAEARVVDALVAAAGDPDPLVREAVVVALAKSDHERAEAALIALTEDPNPRVKSVALEHTRALRSALIAAASRGYTSSERQQLHEAPGPKFGAEPTEAFLGLPLAKYVLESEAFEYAYQEREHGVTPVTVKIVFPPVCSGCLEPTDRSEIDIARQLDWYSGEVFGARTTTTKRTVTTRLPIPLCEQCVGYGLDTLVTVDTHQYVGLLTEVRSDWITIRFPNVAYCDAFASGQLFPIYKKGRSNEPRLGDEDRRRYEGGLQAWSFVRDGLGFHRYAQLKHRLVELSASAPDVNQLAELANEHSITLDQLRDVERIANQAFPVLRALGTP